MESGSILTFVPGAHFNLLAGADSLTEYQFAKLGTLGRSLSSES